MATYSNIFIDQGTTFSISKSLSPTILQLTGYTAAGRIRKTYTSSPSSATFTIKGNNSNVPVLTDANHNTPYTIADTKIVISLTAAQTAALKAGRYVYDIELRKGDTITRVLEGQAEVTPRVTRSFE